MVACLMLMNPMGSESIKKGSPNKQIQAQRMNLHAQTSGGLLRVCGKNILLISGNLAVWQHFSQVEFIELVSIALI